MKLLMIIPHLEFGGAQNIAVGLAEEAVLNGNEVWFLVLYGDNFYKDRLGKSNIKTLSLNYNNGFGVLDIFKLFILRRRFFKSIKNIQPDIIHTHLFLIKCLFFCSSNFFKESIIDTQHDNSPWWKKETMAQRFMTYIESYFVKNVSKYSVAISKSVYEDLIKNTSISKDKVSVVYNFVEPNPYKIHRKVLENKSI